VQELHGGTVITASGGNAVRQLAENAGHDGVVWTIGKARSCMWWRQPEQVKSAIGNAGTYDANNPDIRFLAHVGGQCRGHRPLDGRIKAVDALGKPLILYHGTATTFDQFRAPRQGVYFSSEEEVAQAYAEYAVSKRKATRRMSNRSISPSATLWWSICVAARYSYRGFERASSKVRRLRWHPVPERRRYAVGHEHHAL
jgi:hypothetical protein